MRVPSSRFNLIATAIVIGTLFASGQIHAQGLGVAGNLVTRADGSRRLQVQQVVRGGLGHRVGMVAGDAIVSINGFPPGDKFVNERAIAAGGAVPTIVVERAGSRLTLGNRNVPQPGIFPGNGFELIPFESGPDLQIDLETSSGLTGTRVTVTRVTRGGLGQKLGFRSGDVIDSINRRAVYTTEEAARAYVVNRQRQIVIGVLRVADRGNVVIDEPTLRRLVVNRPHRPGTGKPPGKQPPTVRLKPLELTTFRRPDGKLTVNSGKNTGLGKQLGIAERGTVILSVNGTPVRTPSDLQQFDARIKSGEVTRLTIRVIRPDRTEATVSYPPARRR